VDGIHDLGGRHGFGGSLRERDEQGFHADWERRVFGMDLLLVGRGCFPIDAMRHALERIDPVTYLTAGYYGRWLIGIETLLAEAGGRARPGSVLDTTARRTIPTGPRFAVGAAVRARNLHPPGHVRLPGYARGRRGTVVLQQGAWVLPDTNAHGEGECPEHVYCVRFEARELWGEDGEPGSCVHLELCERYLEPA